MLVIPANMYGNYKKATGWKKFRTFAYWRGLRRGPQYSGIHGQHEYTPGSSITLTPATTPDNATILNS